SSALECGANSRYLSAHSASQRNGCASPAPGDAASPTYPADDPGSSRAMDNIKLSELKAKSPAELLTFAEQYEVENASTMRKQELMFAILKELAAREVDITGEGVVEVLPDGFGFLRSPDA